MQVFISYKSQYRSLATRVRDQLQQWGFKTWFDQDNISQGEYFRYEIQRGLESSEVVVGVITPEALQSREVMWEWDFAIANNRFVPLRWSEVELPYHLRGTQYIDFVNNETHGFEQLRQVLNGEIKLETSPVPAPAVKRQQPVQISHKDDNETRMLKKVRQFWIEGVLDNALRDSQFDLGLTLRTDAVLKYRDYSDYKLSSKINIVQVFEDLGKELLILGAPGAGKTIMMLQLARALLDKADCGEMEAIPVVLNLASWAEKRGSLAEWLIERLQVEYQVPSKQGQKWVEDDRLLLMLDGLDEVNLEHRDECVTTINEFRQQHRTVDMVVCSRVLDYEMLTHQLQLEGAVMLQPLTQELIDEQLSKPDLKGLREAVKNETHLAAMAKTPFLLNTMMFTYRGASATEIGRYADEVKRRDHLLDHYVKRCFDRKNNSPYTLTQIRKWLVWLAGEMLERKQSIFYIESMGWDWLNNHPFQHMHRAYGMAVGVVFGPICGGLMGLGPGMLAGTPDIGGPLGAIAGLVIGVLGGIYHTRNEHIQPTDALTWSFRPWHLLAGVLSWLILLVPIVIIFNMLGVPYEGLVGGMTVGLIALVTTTFSLGVRTSSRVERRLYPNQGITRTFRNMIAYGVCFGILAALTALMVLIAGSIFAVSVSSSGLLQVLATMMTRGSANIIVSGFLIGIGSGIGAAMLFGGAPIVARHVMLRVMLAVINAAPLNYARFLDFTASLGLMRKVGGGYIFIHRTLLEYFGEQKPWQRQN